MLPPAELVLLLQSSGSGYDSFSPVLGALQDQLLEGGHELELGGSFPDALEALPHRSHRFFSGWLRTRE